MESCSRSSFLMALFVPLPQVSSRESICFMLWLTVSTNPWALIKPILSPRTVVTCIATIISLLVCAGDNKVSTKDAFTLFENNTGWGNSERHHTSFFSSQVNN